MNKAVPWNINGVGFDAREAARQAARRQGKSLGEWLDGIIADHAAEHGLELDDIDSQDRIDAVKAKLERLSERPRATGHGRRNPSRSHDHDTYQYARDERDYDPSSQHDRDAMPRSRRVVPRDYPYRDQDYDEARRYFDDGRRTGPGPGHAEFLLEDAIEAMERRASRAERKSEKALSSIAKIIESNGEKQDSEHEIFLALAGKMAEMEARITNRVAGDQKPIKGALTRLEAQLEAMGRRARAGSPGGEGEDLPADADHAPAPSAARPMIPAKTRLNDAIAEITRQQRMLDENAAPAPPGQTRPAPPRAMARPHPHEPAMPPAAPASQGRSAAELDRAPPSQEEPAIFKQLQAGLAAIEARLAHLDRSVPPQHVAAPAPVTPGAPVKDVRSLLQKPREPQFLEKIERRLETLGSKIDHVQRQLDTSAEALVKPAGPVQQPLETLIRSLSDRIETARAPDAHDHAIEDLQDQIGQLCQRFEESGAALAVLPALERSMQSLFAQIEDTRKTVETTAARAAQEAAAVAFAAGTREPPATLLEIAALKSLQEQADRRAHDTLGALHETLEKVVDRLSFMEHEIASVRLPAPAPARWPVDEAETQLNPARARAPALPEAPASRTPVPAESKKPPLAPPPQSGIPRKSAPRDDSRAAAAMPDLVLGEADMAGAPGRAAASQAPSQGRRPNAPRASRNGPGLDETMGRADFIAAARRAARMAQSEPSVLALKDIAQSARAPASRMELVEKSRHYLQTHKKPILMIMAALFVMAGTLAVIGGFQSGAPQGQPGPKAPPPAKTAEPVPGQGGSRQTLPNPEQPAPRAGLQGSQPPATYASQLTASDLSPSALPKGPPPTTAELAGSDTAPTGSLRAIPSFAAQEAARVKVENVNARLKQMADAGDAAAAYELASRYAEGREITRDFSQASGLFEKAARLGFVPAEYKLGSLYEKGAGVPRDTAKARMWYAKAADGGNPRAMHNLAVMIADGDGHPDYTGAVQWFRKAAEYGVHDSQYNLAILYARGLGAKQSLVQSYQWFAIAAGQDDADAAKKRDEVAAKLSPDDLAIGKALAAAFHPKTPGPTATETQAPPGGWDSISQGSPVKNEKPKLSSL